MDMEQEWHSLPGCLAERQNSRIRTVTMDSEEAEELCPTPDLFFDDAYHLSDMMKRLNTMRKAEKFCDVTLKVGCCDVNAHRCVLACASSYLFDLMDSEESTPSKYYVLEQLEPEAVQILVDYAYTAKLQVPFNYVKEVYLAATLLKMTRASDACSQFLADYLSVNNCLGIRSFANSHCDSDLTKKTDMYIQNNILEVVNNPSMQSVPTIQIDIMGVTEEEQASQGERHLGKMVVDWLQHALTLRTFDSLCEDRQVLYLTSDNNLRDCLELDESSDKVLAGSDIIQDYMKMGKRKRMTPVKSAGTIEKHSPPQNGLVKRLSASDKLSSAEKEWKVIAIEKMGDQKWYSLVMLDDCLTHLSLHFRPYPNSPPASLHGDSRDPTPAGSPRSSVAGEKQCLLIPLVDMKFSRCALGTAVLDGKLVALGGYDRGECLDSAEMYDHIKNEWLTLPSMSTPRGRFDVATMNNMLYACGGSNGSEELKSVESYNLDTGKWSRHADIQSRKSSAGVVVVGGKLYVIGGWSGQSAFKECEVFDSENDKWTNIAKLNVGRSQAGVCSYDGKIFAVGGCDAWSPMNSVEVYDPDENTWKFETSLTTKCRGLGAISFKNKIYAVGGSDGSMSLTSVEIFDPATHIWSPGPQLSVARANLSTTVINGRLFAIGGFSGKAFLDTMEYLSENSTEWCSFVPMDLPDRDAKLITASTKQVNGYAATFYIHEEEEEEDVFTENNDSTANALTPEPDL